MKFRFYILYSIFFLSILLPIIFPFIKPGLPITDDLSLLTIRFSAFHQALRDGQIPVRWLGRLNNEYGYPVMNFIYPAPFYGAEIFHLLGLNFQNSIKTILVLSTIFSSFFTFLWLKQKFSKIPALLGAFLYVWHPYYLYDLYSRGSLGEIFALIWPPLIFFFLDRKNWLFASVFTAILITSHNSLAFLFFPIILIYAYLSLHSPTSQCLNISLSSISRYRKYLNISQDFVFFVLFSIFLSAWFTFPALCEQQFTVFSQTQISDWQFPILGRLLQFPFRLWSLTIPFVPFILGWIWHKNKSSSLYFLFTIFYLLSSIVILRQVKYEIKPDSWYSTNESTTTTRDEYLPKWVKIKPAGRPDQKIETLDNNAKISQVKAKNHWISFVFDATASATIQINTVYFPGWQVKIDNQPTTINYTNDRGLIIFSVPSGHHEVLVSFVRTPVRILGEILTITAFIFVLYFFIRKIYRKLRSV